MCVCICVFACESLLIEIYHKIITVILDLDTYIYRSIHAKSPPPFDTFFG